MLGTKQAQSRGTSSEADHAAATPTAIKPDLETQRRFLETLLDNLPFGVAARSMRPADCGQYLIWNEANEVLIGIKAEQALGKCVKEVLAREVAAQVEQWDAQLLASPMVQEYVATDHIPGRGRRLLRTINVPIFGVRDNVEYILTMTADITEEHRRGDELRLASKVFESTADAIILSDTEDRVIMVNAAFSKLTGFGAEEMIGKTVVQSPFRPIDPDGFESRKKRFDKDGFVTGEVSRVRKDGSLLSLWITKTCVRDDAGRIVNYVRVFTDISPLKESERKLEQLASIDTLTGLPNRRLLGDRLEQALRRAARAGRGMGLMFIDLDRLKEINDTHSHAIGDVLLAETGTRLQGCVRASDSVCRFGGDEFVVVLEAVTCGSEATMIGERIVQALAAPFLIADQHIDAAASIGIALYPEHGTNAVTLLENADKAMYCAKKRGGNRFEFFSPQL